MCFKVGGSCYGVDWEGLFEGRVILVVNRAVFAMVVDFYELVGVFVLEAHLLERRVAGDEGGVVKVDDSTELAQL